ncbi:MAG: hypothetical protein ACYTHN_09730, partial [Planctomycetota bacterium]
MERKKITLVLFGVYLVSGLLLTLPEASEGAQYRTRPGYNSTWYNWDNLSQWEVWYQPWWQWRSVNQPPGPNDD